MFLPRIKYSLQLDLPVCVSAINYWVKKKNQDKIRNQRQENMHMCKKTCLQQAIVRGGGVEGVCRGGWVVKVGVGL